jgi:hypothetical protein
MRHPRPYFVLIVFALFFIASAPTNKYYQVYETASENVKLDANYFEYEDENCIVSYNLWSEGGSMGVYLFNKTNKIMKIDKEQSFFILNGIANDYFLNSINSKANDVSYGDVDSYYFKTYNKKSSYYSSKSYSNATSYEEKAYVLIPPKTSKRVLDHKINQTLFKDCDLPLFPISKRESNLSFTVDKSPFVFSNLIKYTIENAEYSFKNDFYVKSITNMRKDDFMDIEYEYECGKKTGRMVKLYKVNAPYKFYIEYVKSSSSNGY